MIVVERPEDLTARVGVRVTLDLTFELKGSERPACVGQIEFISSFAA